MEDEIKRVIGLGENINTEFKLASSDVPKSIFETVCAFLNTSGGYIILGVNDKREAVGVNKDYINKIKKDLSVTKKEIARNINILLRTIERNFEELKRLNIIERIGGKKMVTGK